MQHLKGKKHKPKFEFRTLVKTDHLQEAFAIVATGETALYGNIILKKGVIPKTNDEM